MMTVSEFASRLRKVTWMMSVSELTIALWSEIDSGIGSEILFGTQTVKTSTSRLCFAKKLA